MPTQNTTQCVIFPDLFDKPTQFVFDEPAVTSDAGAVFLRAADKRLRLLDRLAATVDDNRDGDRVVHELRTMLAQRVNAIACGYPDTNDAARLADDPVHRMLVHGNPRVGEDDVLASQPTLSRFENAVGSRDMFRLGGALADAVVARHKKRMGRGVRRITIDLDHTDDPTHGQQEFAFYHGHYHTWCYLPMLGFISFDDEDEQYLFTAVLRPGDASAKKNTRSILRQILRRCRRAFPKAEFYVRLDGGFASPEVFEYLDRQGDVKYAVGMAENAVLTRYAERRMTTARAISEDTGETAHVYGERQYRAGTWRRTRRAVIKAEVVRNIDGEAKDNPRFVITNMTQSARWVYEDFYCRRGEIENRIKELQIGMAMDRTSSHRFWTNQFRVLMTAAAYVLMQEIRLQACGTFARAQVWTIRDHLLKIGSRMVATVRRFCFHLPISYPYVDEWRRLALAFGATTPRRT